MQLLSTAMYFLTFIVLALSTTNIKAQNTSALPNKFVQLYVVGITSSTESRAIDAIIRAKDGILMSRTDHHTRILFCIFEESATINESKFINWLNGLGFQISCYREGIHGQDKVYSKEEYVCD